MPLLVITDGGPGLRTPPAKVSKADQAELKADWWGVFDDIEAEPGPDSVAEATRGAERLAAKWQRRYPGAVACLIDDLPSLPPTCASSRSIGAASGTPIS